MTRVRRICVLVLAMCVLVPAAARAQDWWDWLGDLSGPGPFTGVAFTMRTVCAHDDGKTLTTKWCLNDTDPAIRTVLNVEYAWATTGKQARFQDTPGDQNVVHQQRVAATYMYRVGPMLDVGVGGGVIWLTGDSPTGSFDTQVHPILIPATMTFTPMGLLRGPTSKKWGRVLRIKFSERYIFRDLNALDFKSASSYFRNGEFNPSFSFAFDFWSLVTH